MAALSTSAFTGKAVVSKTQIRAKSSRASVVVKASASDKAKVSSRDFSSRPDITTRPETTGWVRTAGFSGAPRRGGPTQRCSRHGFRKICVAPRQALDPLRKAILACTCRENKPSVRVLTTNFPSLLPQSAAVLAAGIVALNATPAFALNAIELTDQRETNKNGLQLIYEVSDPPTRPRSRPLLFSLICLDRISIR